MSTQDKTLPFRPRSEPTNGTPLPEHRQRQVEAGLSAYQNVLAERDQLERQLREAVTRIEGLNVQLSSLQGVVNMMESSYLTQKMDLEKRVAHYQSERDDAVRNSAVLETILTNVQKLLDRELVDTEHPHVG